MVARKNCAFCGGPCRLPTDEFCCLFCAEDHSADVHEIAEPIEDEPRFQDEPEEIDGGVESDIDSAVDEDNGEEE
jgi:hypothetical protein